MTHREAPESPRAQWLIIGVVGFLVLGVDQVTKTLVVDRLHQAVHVVGPLSLQLTYNSGVAFSLGTGFGLPIVFVVAVLLVILFAQRRHRQISKPAAVGAGLILGGALGNLADRLFRGHGGSVVDFIHTTFWPTFNVADSAVVCGCIIMFFVYWRHSSDHGQQRAIQQQTKGRDYAE